MVKYETPVYHKVRELLSHLDIHTTRSPKWFRQEVINKHKAEVMSVLVWIVEGNLEKEKLPKNILVSLNVLERLKLCVRVARDSNYITDAGIGEIARPLEESRRQLRGWGRSVGLMDDDFPKSFDIYKLSENVEFVK